MESSYRRRRAQQKASKLLEEEKSYGGRLKSTLKRERLHWLCKNALNKHPSGLEFDGKIQDSFVTKIEKVDRHFDP